MALVGNTFDKIASMAKAQESATLALTQLKDVQKAAEQALTILTKGQEANSLTLQQMKMENGGLSQSLAEQQQGLLRTVERRIQEMDNRIATKLLHVHCEYDAVPQGTSSTFLLVCSVIAAFMLACGHTGQSHSVNFPTY